MPRWKAWLCRLGRPGRPIPWSSSPASASGVRHQGVDPAVHDDEAHAVGPAVGQKQRSGTRAAVLDILLCIVIIRPPCNVTGSGRTRGSRPWRATGWASSRTGWSPRATAASSMPARRRGAALDAAETIDLRGPLDHAGPDRLPHPSRLWRRPRARIRAAARGRELRGDRAGRRRHRLDGARDARGERGRSWSRSALPRLDALIAEGVTTVEIKSGYGLDRSTRDEDAAGGAALGERAAAVGRRRPSSARMRCRRKRAATRTRYIDRGLRRDAPGRRRGRAGRCGRRVLRRHRLSRREQIARVFEAAQGAGLPVKLHAEQLSNLHGAALAARYGALSADHLEYTDEAGVAAMAQAGTVAVLLPGAFYFAARDADAAGRRCCAGTACRSRSRPTAIPAPRRSPRCCWR